MKKVLLTTTALVMTAGVAAAEVSMSGKAQVSIGAAGTADNELNTHIDFNVAISGASDNGITMSTGFGYDRGNMVDGDHYDGDEASDWSQAAPELTIGYNGYTISAQKAGVADLYNGDISSGDLGISGSMGDISFAATTNVGGGDDDSSYKVSTAMGDVTATLVGTNHADGAANVDATKLTLTYAMGDTTFTASSNDSDANAEAITSLGFSTKMDAITFAYTAKSTGAANSSVGDHWDASISYAAGALTASYALDEDDISTLKAGYDLGGGTSLFAVMKNGETAAGANKDFQAIGLNFTF